MKIQCYLTMVFFLVQIFTLKAQNIVKPILQGTNAEFLNKLKNPDSKNNQTIKLSSTKSVKVDILGEKQVGNSQIFKGTVRQKNAVFNLRKLSDKIEGSIILRDTKEAFKLYSDSKNNVYSEEVPIDEVVCSEYNKAPQGSQIALGSLPPGQSLYNLQSYPAASAVVLLDYDGQFVPAGPWGSSIDALPALLNDDEKYSIWEMISEDFRPFKLNITTSEIVYQNAPATMRTRVIFTPTTTAQPGAGGVAYIGSFTWGDDTPCWVFNSGAKFAGEAGSHEIGHTLRLYHHGRYSGTGINEEYYYGHGDWAPIMGVGYGVPVVQWSKGEYEFSNNSQDDIATIASSFNGFGFKNDLIGNSVAQSSPLVVNNAGEVISSSNYGLIEDALDVDVFSFSTTGGNATLLVSTVAEFANLDVSLKLTDANNNLITLSNPAGANASLNMNLNPGTYFLHVDGTGSKNPFLDGYSDYGSVGYYSISGKITQGSSLRNPENPVSILNGLNYSYYEGAWSTLPDFNSLVPVKRGTVGSFNISPKNRAYDYAMSYTGYISVPTDGQYTFYTSSDDGSTLSIGQTFIVNNDGLHGLIEKSGTIGLKAGKHKINVNFFQQGGGENLIVSYSGPGITKNIIPASVLYRVVNPTTFSGFYQIISKKSGKVLDVYNSSMQNGGKIVQWENNGTDRQKWLMEKLADGSYKITAKHSGKALDVKGVSLSGGATLHQWDFSGGDNQKWKVESINDGYYRIIARHSNLAMTVSSGSIENGASILQLAYSGTENQKWEIRPLPSASLRFASANTEEPADNLKVHPTLTHGPFEVSYIFEKEGLTEIEIINEFSQVQLSKDIIVKKGLNNFHFDISNMENGLYILKIWDGSRFKVKKMIKY